MKDDIDLTKVLKYEEIDNQINVILDQLNDYNIGETKVREFEKLIETFVNKISDTIKKITDLGLVSKYNSKRLEAYNPLIDYLEILKEKKLLTNDQAQRIIDKHLVDLEGKIYENINKSFNKYAVKETISRKWE